MKSRRQKYNFHLHALSKSRKQAVGKEGFVCDGVGRINKTDLWRIHHENPLIPPQARVDIYCDCALRILFAVCPRCSAFNHPQCLTTDRNATSLT